MLFRLYAAAMLALFCCYCAAIVLLLCCYCAAIVLLFCCYSAAILLLFCCYSAAILLLSCCYPGFSAALFFYAVLYAALCFVLFYASQQTSTTTSTAATTSSSNKAQMTPNRGSAIKGPKNTDRHVASGKGAVVLDHQAARPLCLVPCRSGSAACFCCMPTRARLTTQTKPAIAHLPRTTMPREIPPSSAAKLRAPPRLPHSTFSSSDVTRRKPPARAASRSADDRESRSALLAPAVDREGHPATRSRPERPRSREQEPRLTFDVRRCTVCFRGKCDVLARFCDNRCAI